MIKQSTIYILLSIFFNYFLSTLFSFWFFGVEAIIPNIPIVSAFFFTIFLGLILGESIHFEKKSKTFCYNFSVVFFLGTSALISIAFKILDEYDFNYFLGDNLYYSISYLFGGAFSFSHLIIMILLGYSLSLLNTENIYKNQDFFSKKHFKNIKIEEKNHKSIIKIPFLLFLKAILIELTLAVITFFVFSGSLNIVSIYDITKISPYIGLGLAVMLIISYLSHRFINLRSKTMGFCIWLGILLMFFSLHLAINISYMVYAPLHWFELDNFFILNLIFLIFGGVQTLCVGIWLGYQMSKLRQ